jgi:hypothetical protein
LSACPACTAATEAPAFVFYAQCRGCTARTIARSQTFWQARQANDSNALETLRYREMLAQVGGGHIPPLAHSEVMAAFKSDAAIQKTQQEAPTT